MNERIKELAGQAGPLQEVLSEIYGGTPGRYVRNKALLDFQLEKFAKLIVQECAFYMYENYPHSRYEVNFMRRHMGDPDWNKPIKDQLEL